MTVSVLFCDKRGPYFSLPGVDCWDEERDATKFPGGSAIVSHPPCGPWGKLAHMCGQALSATKHLGPLAVEQVRANGGVLEHPAGSKLWGHCGMPSPVTCQNVLFQEGLDSFGGYTVEVDQCEWGHVARKRTWLYLVRIPLAALENPPFPGRVPTHRIGSTTCGRIDGTRYRPLSNLKSASALERRLTPPLFAEYLIRLAKAVY